MAIASDPFHAGILYVGAIPGVFRSADDGLTWQGPSLGLPPYQVLSLVADPADPAHLYCVTDNGHVYRTMDGAQTWHDFSAGLGYFPAQALVISPDGRWLHAGTSEEASSSSTSRPSAPASACAPSASRLCLVGNRYAVDLIAARAGKQRLGSGRRAAPGRPSRVLRPALRHGRSRPARGRRQDASRRNVRFGRRSGLLLQPDDPALLPHRDRHGHRAEQGLRQQSEHAAVRRNGSVLRGVRELDVARARRR